jgi:hypothetical protein
MALILQIGDRRTAIIHISYAPYVYNLFLLIHSVDEGNKNRRKINRKI